MQTLTLSVVWIQAVFDLLFINVAPTYHSWDQESELKMQKDGGGNKEVKWFVQCHTAGQSQSDLEEMSLEFQCKSSML